MDIAVYSGSFNPLHIGHLAIMKHIGASGRFGRTYLVVSPKNPLKDGISADSGRARYLAAIEAVRRHPELNVRVHDIELRMEPPHYSIRTLDALQAQEPEHRFVLVIGADNLSSFRQWRDYRRILTDYGVAVYPREGYDAAALRANLLAENHAYRIELLDAPIVDISSTEIREGISAGRDMSKFMM